MDNMVSTTQVLGKWHLVVVTPRPLPDPSSGRLLGDGKAGLSVSSPPPGVRGNDWPTQLAQSLH